MPVFRHLLPLSAHPLALWPQDLEATDLKPCLARYSIAYMMTFLQSQPCITFNESELDSLSISRHEWPDFPNPITFIFKLQRWGNTISC